MADRLTSNELEKMQRSVTDMTDLSKNLRSEFIKIRNTTNLLSDDFKKIITDAGATYNIAQKYLVAQKVTQTLTEKINELKSKSGFLDNISLQFKKNELDLQKKITTAQISRLIKSTALDAAAKKEAIDALKLKMILSDVELEILEKNLGKNNSIVDSLNQQLSISEGIVNNIQLIGNGLIDTNTPLNALKTSFEFIFGKSGLIVKDLGKLGEYIQNGITPSKLLTDILQKGYENFKSFDSAATKARQSLGLLPGQANVLEKNIKRTTIELMHLGATFDDVSKSVQAIASEITGILADDLNLLKTTTAVAKQFGISETTSAKFLKTLGGISGTSSSSQQSMIGFAQKISAASKVPLDILMKDVAEASDDTRIYVGNSAVSLVKAAAAARMLGTDLNKAAASAEKLLQFESSIGAELKASALLGQNINFNYARQLSFNKNIIGANQEILRIAKQVNFNQLNPIQQKAFADAAGKSVGELQDMFQQEKNIALVRNGTNKEAKKALADYERMMKLKDDEAKNEGERAAQEIIRRANQERLNQIQNRFNQLMSELAEPVMEVTEMLLDIAIKILPPIVNAIKYMTPIVGVLKSVYLIAEEFDRIGNSLKSFANMFNYIKSLGAGFFVSIKQASIVFSQIYNTGTKISTTVGIIGSVGSVLSSVGTKVMKIFTTIGNFITKIPLIGGPLIKVLGIFGRFLGPLGVIINIFTFISSLMKRWEETPKGFLGGLKAIGGALYDTLLKPFKDAYDWIASLFVGKSPSKLGLGIVNGIESVGTMVLDVLMSPYKFAFNSILNLFSNLGDPIINGIKSIGSTIADTLTSPFKSSYNWIMDNLGGKSPSEIGLSILNGMTSVSNKLTDSISNPFKSAFDSILGLAPTDIGLLIISGLQDNLISAIDPFKSSLNSIFDDFGKNLSTEIVSSITNGLKSSESIIQNAVKTNVSDITLPTTEFNVENVGEPTVRKLESTTSPIQQVIEVGNQQLIQKIDQLISLMSNGGISVNLDGQLVSRTLATTAYKSGGFGQSTTRA